MAVRDTSLCYKLILKTLRRYLKAMQLEQLLCSFRASTKNINFSEWAILSTNEYIDPELLNPPLLPQFHRVILNGFIIICFPPVDILITIFHQVTRDILYIPYFPFYDDKDNWLPLGLQWTDIKIPNADVYAMKPCTVLVIYWLFFFISVSWSLTLLVLGNQLACVWGRLL